MEIARSLVVRMLIMSLLTILATQVHCSTQPANNIPNSSLDHLTRLLEASNPISFVTSHSSVHVDRFSTHEVDPGELERARNYPWKELLGKPLSEVVQKVNEVLPSASIIVKEDFKPAYALQYNGPDLAAVLFTDKDSIVHAITIVQL